MASTPPSAALLSAQRAQLGRAWRFAIVYTLFVILFGAIVRITGSGAGCGQHWPTCHGEIAHLPQSIETFIELTHRLTSGLSMLLVFGLTLLTFHRTERGHGARAAALWSCAFMITEALVGAGLVLLELVGQNDSVPRAVVMGIHLLNTSALLFALLAVTWLVFQPGSPRLQLTRGFGKAPLGEGFWSGPAYAIGAVLLLAVMATGAVTALGDTVYPVGERSSLEVARALTRSGGHFFGAVAGVHPLLASAAAAFFIMLGARAGSRWGQLIVATTVGQVALGLLNIQWSAPGWMQVLHLAVANLLWIAWVMAWFTRRADSVEETRVR